jgi:hypothetical protein
MGVIRTGNFSMGGLDPPIQHRAQARQLKRTCARLLWMAGSRPAMESFANLQP